MCKVISSLTGMVRRFADLECGDRILPAALMEMFPNASGVLLDCSSSMLEQAKDRFRTKGMFLKFV